MLSVNFRILQLVPSAGRVLASKCHLQRPAAALSATHLGRPTADIHAKTRHKRIYSPKRTINTGIQEYRTISMMSLLSPFTRFDLPKSKASVECCLLDSSMTIR